MKTLATIAMLGTIAALPVTVSAQSKSMQEANQHHRNQMQARERSRQQDNRTVQQSNSTYRRK